MSRPLPPPRGSLARVLFHGAVAFAGELAERNRAAAIKLAEVAELARRAAAVKAEADLQRAYALRYEQRRSMIAARAVAQAATELEIMQERSMIAGDGAAEIAAQADLRAAQIAAQADAEDQILRIRAEAAKKQAVHLVNLAESADAEIAAIRARARARILPAACRTDLRAVLRFRHAGARRSHRVVRAVVKTAAGDSGDPDPEPPTTRRYLTAEVAP